MAEDKNNRVKVVGYAQRTFFDDGIEYRNFSDSLVGQQFTDDGGTSLFTAGNFKVTTNLNPRLSRGFYTGKYTNFFNLDNLNLTDEQKKLIEENSKVKLNLDKSDLRNYAYYGSLVEYMRVSLEEIIIKWPAALYTENLVPFSTSTGYTIQNYNNNVIEAESTFRVPITLIRNKFEINYLTNGRVTDSFSDTNDLRNLTVNYADYVLTINDTDYNVLEFTGATTINDDYLSFKVSGNPLTGTQSTDSFYIRPNKRKREEFFNQLPDFESYLLNRLRVPEYTATFRFPKETDTGIILFDEETVKWPTTDGYNIDFDTTEYVTYAGKLLEIGENYDENQSDYIVRFLVAESISDFDTVQKSDDSLNDSAGQKMTRTLRIYGREFDEIKRKIDGLQYANTVTYNKENNTPNIVLKNIARTLGWELTTSMLGNDLIGNYLDIQESTYSGESRGLTPLEAEHELWRRLVLNSAWLWKSKGTRKSLEFLFRFIGAPEGLMTLNEYLYVADGKIDVDTFKKVLELNNLDTDTDLYNIDLDGYPKAFRNTSEMYFQKGGAWYRETGGANATKYVLNGNNPHAGPYDGGKAYKGQFETLIPNFSAVTITEETVTTGSTNVFTNYNSGFFNNLVDETVYLKLFDSVNNTPNYFTVGDSIIDDPNPTTEATDCGCDEEGEDKSLLLDYELLSHLTVEPTPPLNRRCTSDESIIMEPTGVSRAGDPGQENLDIYFFLIDVSTGMDLPLATPTQAQEFNCRFQVGDIIRIISTSPFYNLFGNGPIGEPNGTVSGDYEITTVGSIGIALSDINGNTFTYPAGSLGKLAAEITLTNLTTNKSYGNQGTTPDPATQNIPNQSTFSPFTTVLTPKLDNGNFFYVDDDETCTLNVKFDFLAKFDGNDIISEITGENPSYTTVSELFESFKLSWNLELYDGGNRTVIYTESLFDTGDDFTEYVKNNTNTGIYLSDGSINSVKQRLINEFGTDCDSVKDDTIKSDWLHIEKNISDQGILGIIKNQRIAISVTLTQNSSGVKFGYMFDKINLIKECVEIESVDSTITSSPGFSLYRAVDNKKSWVSSDDKVSRSHDLTLRDTSYDIKHHNLGINTKEIDLRFDYAKPLEYDVFSYYQQCDFEDITYTACGGTVIGCPVGYTLTPDGDSCILETTVAAAITGDTYDVSSWREDLLRDPLLAPTIPISAVTYGQGIVPKIAPFGLNGTRFYGDLTGLELPLQLKNGVTWEVVDASGDLSPYPDTFFNPNGVDVPLATDPVKSAIWGTGYGNGRLYEAGVWVNPHWTFQDVIDVDPTNNLGWISPTQPVPLSASTLPIGTQEFIGFSHCVEVVEAGTYWVGIGADNYFRFKLNGELIFFFENPSGYHEEAYESWHMFQLELKSGKNIIEMEGANDHPTSTVAFASEIYSADLNTLVNATTEAQLGLIFSTRDLIGSTFDIGDNSGYSACPVGYALDNCNITPVCTLIDRTDPIETDGNVTKTSNPSNLLCSNYTADTLTYEELFDCYSSNLIDVKSNKILQSYPLLRKVYDDYLDVDLRCLSKSPLGYEDAIGFGELIDNFWVDLIEQVMPSTAMWSSTNVYRNSLFDFNKVQYKRYNLINADKGSDAPFDVIGTSTGVEVLEFDISDVENNPECAQVTITSGNTSNVSIIKTSDGSEFYGTITILDINGNALVAE